MPPRSNVKPDNNLNIFMRINLIIPAYQLKLHMLSRILLNNSRPGKSLTGRHHKQNNQCKNTFPPHYFLSAATTKL